MQRVIERVLNLLAFLLTAERPVTADEIRTTVAGYDQESDAAWRRMFERDKDLLRGLGIPLETMPTDAWGVEHGYTVPRDEYALPDPGLTDQERAALFLAAKVVRIGGNSGADALFKLGGAPLVAAGEPLAADLGSEPGVLAGLFVALTEKRLAEFDYGDKRRSVAAYGLVHRRGHWYLVGPEHGASTIKVFRVDRIPAVDLGEETDAFERPVAFRAGDAIPAAPWEAGPEDTRATVRFDSSIAWWARRRLAGSGEVIEGADGELEVTLDVANPEAFIGWILSFDAAAEILEPPALRRRLIEKVEAAG